MIGPTFEVSANRLVSNPVVTVKGDIDVKTAPRFAAALSRFDGEIVIADLTEVDFIDSTGLRTLMRARQSLDAHGGRLVVCAPEGGSVLRTIRLAGLESDFEIVADLEAFRPDE